MKEQYSRLDSMEQMKSISDELKLMLDAGGQVDSETELNASDSNVQTAIDADLSIRLEFHVCWFHCVKLDGAF